MSFGWRVGVSEPGWQTLYEAKYSAASLSSVYHLRLICRILTILPSVALTCVCHIVPRCCGACEIGWWARSHNALSRTLYSHSPDSVGRNQPIVDMSGGTALRCACVYLSIHLKYPPMVLSGRPRIEKSKEKKMGDGPGYIKGTNSGGSCRTFSEFAKLYKWNSLSL